MLHKTSGLADVPKWQNEVTIVPFSGIQILDFGFNLDDVKSKSRFLEKTVSHEGEMTKRMLVPLPANVDEAAQIEATRAADDPDPYTIDQDRALAPFLDNWVPVPILRIKRDSGVRMGERYDPGPTSWARIRVVALPQPDAETGHTHRVQLSLDTMLGAKNAEDRYIAPEEGDVHNPREFRFVSAPNAISWFISDPKPYGPEKKASIDHQYWVSEWVHEIFLAFKQAEAEDLGRHFSEDKLKYDFEHWARYLQFLATIDEAIAIPKFRFVDSISERDSSPPVDVDLVLDIGNSRTCGIFIERFPDGTKLDLTRSFELSLRDLSRPEFVYSGLIESRVEFAELTFGKERYASLSGRGNGFLWPSFVRVGPEAQRLTRGEMGTETTSGLSSPKRYLWDVSPTRQDWRFHNHTNPTVLPRNVRAVMQYLNEAGDVLDVVEREIKDGVRAKDASSMAQAIRPRFSRSSVYTFMLCELISQALMQINDPAGRMRRHQAALPRRLARIILTLPTATPVQEQKIIRSRANAALALVWKRLGITEGSSNISEMPELIVEWDEASCTQLVYLYSEIAQRLNGQIDSYIGLKGKRRKHPKTDEILPAVRMACIDIGGGTTDLMVTTYFGKDNALLDPDQTFREGFRIAGDDLLRKIISDIVLPDITASVEAAGGQDVGGRLRELFAGDVGGGDAQMMQKRRQFMLQVLQPIAVAIISAAEVAKSGIGINISAQEVLGTVADPAHAAEIAAMDIPPEDHPDVRQMLTIAGPILGYLEDAMRMQGAPAWSIQDLELSVSAARVDMVVRDVFHGALDNMLEVIDHLDTDIILLTGRPSRLPVIRAMVEEKMVVPPDRLISMHAYRTDKWYPYRNLKTQRIEDPKSTVAVGGMLIALAGNRMPNFKVMTEAYRMRSTARYIGPMESNDQIQAEKVLFHPGNSAAGERANTRQEITLYNPRSIGFRQLKLERWTTTPIYQLDFASDESRNKPMPFTVTLERPEIDGEEDDMNLEKLQHLEALQEVLTVTEVFDGHGNEIRVSDVTMVFQTMGLQSDYWLDTGIVG